MDEIVVADIAVQDQTSLVVKTPSAVLTPEAFGMLQCVVLVELGLVWVDMAAELALVQGEFGVITMMLVAMLDKLVVSGERQLTKVALALQLVSPDH